MMLKCLCLLLKPCRFTDVTVVISIFWQIKNCIVDKHYLQIDCLCSFLFLVFIRTWSKTARILSIIWQSGVVRIQKLGIIPMPTMIFWKFSLVISHEISWYPPDLGFWDVPIIRFWHWPYVLWSIVINTPGDFANGMVISPMVGLQFFPSAKYLGESQVHILTAIVPKKSTYSITRHAKSAIILFMISQISPCFLGITWYNYKLRSQKNVVQCPVFELHPCFTSESSTK